MEEALDLSFDRLLMMMTMPCAHNMSRNEDDLVLGA